MLATLTMLWPTLTSKYEFLFKVESVTVYFTYFTYFLHLLVLFYCCFLLLLCIPADAENVKMVIIFISSLFCFFTLGRIAKSSTFCLACFDLGSNHQSSGKAQTKSKKKITAPPARKKTHPPVDQEKTHRKFSVQGPPRSSMVHPLHRWEKINLNITSNEHDCNSLGPKRWTLYYSLWQTFYYPFVVST